MNALSFVFKKVLYPACAFFTIIWFCLCLLIDQASESGIININPASTVMCFALGLALSLCNLILKREKIPFVGRFFIHMALSIFSFSIVVAIFSSLFPTAYLLTTRSFYLVLILVVLYLVIGTPSLLLYHHFFLSKKEKGKQ